MTVEFPSTFKPHSFSNVVQGATHHKLQNGWIYFLKEIHLRFQNFKLLETLHGTASKALRYTAFRNTDLTDTQIWIGYKHVWGLLILYCLSRYLCSFEVDFTWILHPFYLDFTQNGFTKQEFFNAKIKMFFMESEVRS